MPTASSSSVADYIARAVPETRIDAPGVAEISARQGAEVTLTSVFAIDNMQANKHEIEQAEAEGATVTPLFNFLEQVDAILTRYEFSIPRRAIRHLEKGRVVIFGAGAGMPFFTTDTVAAQRALEIGANALLLAKSGVDGVYNADPRKDPSAVKFDEISYDEVLQKSLAVADAAAFSLCRENKLPIVVFDLMAHGNIGRAVRGEKIGTLVN